MNNKFVLWACGIVISTVLLITSWGVLIGSYEWTNYQTLWSGIVGTLMGYVIKSLETRGK